MKFWKTENDLAAWRNQTPKSLHGAKPASSQRPVHSRPPDKLRTHGPVKTRVREERSGKGGSLYREQDTQFPLPSRSRRGTVQRGLVLGTLGPAEGGVRWHPENGDRGKICMPIDSVIWSPPKPADPPHEACQPSGSLPCTHSFHCLNAV